jgi:hypothetical protein
VKINSQYYATSAPAEAQTTSLQRRSRAEPRCSDEVRLQSPPVSEAHLQLEETHKEQAGTDPQTILAACFEQGVKLTRFDTSAPPLHEIFVYLAGGNAEGLEP